MMPVGMAMVFEVFPPERRGQAMGVWGVSAMAGPAIGPTLGGYLVTNVSWHWLFLVNVPIGVLGVVLATRFLRDFGYRDHRPLDGLGLGLGASGLALTLLGVSQSTSWGWGSPTTIACVAIGGVLLAGFVAQELHTPDPAVEIRMFAVPVFAVSMGVILFTAAAQYTRLVFMPLELENLRGYTALRVGVLLIPSALATAAAMPIGGRLVDRVGARLPTVAGCTLMMVALFSLGMIDVHTPILLVVAFLALQGFGMGLTSAPATVAGMNALSGRFVAQASAMRSLSSQVAGATAIAVMSTVVASRMGESPTTTQSQHAYNSAFLLAGVGLAVAVLLAFRLPRTPEHETVAEPVLEL
jgi:DHA2 family multidrug resistance protein